MTADKDKIDKVVRLVGEGRTMGMTVLGPDVNESLVDFSVVYSNPDGDAKFAKGARLSDKLLSRADEKEALFKKEPFHPSLETHKLHGKDKDTWAFSIDRKYSIKFIFLKNDSVLFLAQDNLAGAVAVCKEFAIDIRQLGPELYSAGFFIDLAAFPDERADHVLTAAVRAELDRLPRRIRSCIAYS